MLKADILDERDGRVFVAIGRVEAPDMVTGFWMPKADATMLVRQLTLGVEMAQAARDFVTLALDSDDLNLSMLDSAPIGTEVTNSFGATATKMLDPFCGQSWHVEGEHELDRRPSNWVLNEFPEYRMAGVR